MFDGQKVVVVMPAYNAASTLEQTHREVLASGIVDLVIVVDDASQDQTFQVAQRLDRTRVFQHPVNMGYGANQKTCYRHALAEGADIVVMLHPDYQYTPRLLPALVSMVASGMYGCVLGSRILGGQALRGGMPLWKYVGNRLLTAWGNLFFGTALSEFHTGYRAFSGEILRVLPLEANSDDFVFDNQLLAEVIWRGVPIGEVSCPARYAPDSSSINFRRSVVYGLGCLASGLEFRLAKMALRSSPRFPR